jgi:hypothetical protein
LPKISLLEKIISGGQTGADRAALDFAIERGIAYGGWCPLGRVAEDGIISECYRLMETPLPDYAQRTEWNVRDSDGTVIFSTSEVLSGGSKLTADFAAQYNKPCLHLSEATHGRSAAAVHRLRDFVTRHGIKCLNVAGSRESVEPAVREFTLRTLAGFFDAQRDQNGSSG